MHHSWRSAGAVSTVLLAHLVSVPHVRSFLYTERRKADGVTLHFGNSAIQRHSLLRSSLASLLLQQIVQSSSSCSIFHVCPLQKWPLGN